MTRNRPQGVRRVYTDGVIDARAAGGFDGPCRRSSTRSVRSWASGFRLAMAVPLLAVALAAIPSAVPAGEASGRLRISLVVVASCNVQTHPVAFAAYTTGGAAVATAAPGAIDVNCTRNVPAAVYLEGERVLTGPDGARVAYALQANGKAWPVGEALHVQGRGSEPVRLSITGTVPAGQSVAAGNYADDKVIRVVY